MSSSAIVELRRVGRRFRQRWSVRGVQLTIGSGEMVSIVGADGAGKTTLLQMCAAILDPSEGTCRVLGFDTVRDSKAVTARIGYMSQGFTLYDRLSVEENLRFSARIRDVSPSVYATRRARLLEMADLAAFHQRPAGQLSGGMRKKLALCSNLIHEPRLLILDEPGLGVDPLSRRQLWGMLETFREQGITIVVASSYMEEAERCDRVVLLHEGTALAVDRPEAVRRAAAGKVYELLAEDSSRAAVDLEQHPEIYGVQVLPDRLRFQRTPPTGQARLKDSRMTQLPGVRQVAPTLEDVFVLHAGPQTDALAGTGPVQRLDRNGTIAADRLSVAFGEFRAVDTVSMEATPGTLLALLGPNGAGKTTLIRAFCGLVPISDGTAWIAGTRVTSGASPVRQLIGYMSQRFSLYSDLTLGENLEFYAAAYGMRRSAAEDAIHWVSTMTGLAPDDVRTPVAAMSGATRQRLALACSILHRPSVLFLDEPTSGVDPVSRYRFWRLIRILAGAGMVIVVTMHYLNEAEYCDRIGLMHRGRLIALGSLQELRELTGNDGTASVEKVFVSAMRQAALEPQ